MTTSPSIWTFLRFAVFRLTAPGVGDSAGSRRTCLCFTVSLLSEMRPTAVAPTLTSTAPHLPQVLATIPTRLVTTPVRLSVFAEAFAMLTVWRQNAEPPPRVQPLLAVSARSSYGREV